MGLALILHQQAARDPPFSHRAEQLWSVCRTYALMQVDACWAWA